jgi:MFS family permease
VATTIARLPIGINGLAIVLAMRSETGSFAAAGAAAGAYALTLGVSSPIQGRLLDRLGPRRVLPPMIVFHAAAMLSFVALLSHAPTALLVVLAGVAGLGLPPWSSILRAMWPRLLGDDELITTAFALDGAMVETVFILGPLLVAVAVSVASAQAALVASVVLALAGTALLMASPAIRAWEREVGRGRDVFGALRSHGLLTVVVATVPIGFAFGAVEIALPAFATAHGSPGRAGLLIAVWALGSGAGALIYGARIWPGPLARRWLACATLLGGALLLPLAASSIGVLLALLLPTGAFIAPTIASSSQLMGGLAPPGMATEAYAWNSTAIVVGAAAGSAVAGALVEASTWRAAVAAAGATALAGAALGFARRRTLI